MGAVTGAVTGALTILVGGALCKLATAAALMGGGVDVASVLLRLVSAFLQDAVLAAVVLTVGRRTPRVAMSAPSMSSLCSSTAGPSPGISWPTHRRCGPD
jgi:hypothetical protein